jgi:hypothetical protein
LNGDRLAPFSQKSAQTKAEKYLAQDTRDSWRCLNI